MSTRDIHFKPGDKVMRVGSTCVCSYRGDDAPKSVPQFNIVYCVEDFYEGPRFNAVMLVGFGGRRYANGMPVGWRASNFRTVEEIKLCIQAVSKKGNARPQPTITLNL